MPTPAIHPLAHMVERLAVRTNLEDADRAALLDLPYALRPFEPKSYLVREGDVPDQCRVILSGFVVRHKISGEGLRQIASVHVRGDILDLQHLYLRAVDHNMQTLTRCEIALIPNAALHRLVLRKPSIGVALFTKAQVEASEYRESMLNISRRDARTRVAHLLCELVLKLDVPGLPRGQGYELPMSQEELADVVGLTAVHVNRTLKALVEEGLIVRKERLFTFPDWNRLTKEADFNSRYLHMDGSEGYA